MKLLSYITIITVGFILIIVNQTDVTNYNTVQDKVLQESIKRGNDVYADFCITCHLDSGEGVKNTFPPLANSDYLKTNRESSIKGLKYGLKGKITVNGKVYNSYMAPQGLGNDEIADVMNYINHSWGNTYGEIVTEEEVAKIKK
ncbi:c-type cytochrome [Winogradskyella immobilis]|uniref:Cytochrome c n=1 Tax=Winogradskyella immobilis TaxID=2816852 RepID=A0ABS8EQ48_9FLAO|nr:cytochrome c [Winogradskyella immobilis]MCC1484957.1 cytochrome c [Winogradskyella immobilis]MCG0017049.1 cytochrome c [Winogradskyella immobilis]